MIEPERYKSYETFLCLKGHKQLGIFENNDG